MLAVMISMNSLTRLCKNAVSIPHRFSTLPLSLYFAVVQLLSCVWLLVIPWIVAHQASLSFTIPGVCSNSHPLSQWCHPTSVTPISSCPPSFPASRSFPMSRLCIRWPKYWSFSFSVSPSNENARFTSFQIHWFDFLAVQGILESSPAPQFESTNSYFSMPFS